MRKRRGQRPGRGGAAQKKKAAAAAPSPPQPQAQSAPAPLQAAAGEEAAAASGGQGKKALAAAAAALTAAEGQQPEAEQQPAQQEPAAGPAAAALASHPLAGVEEEERREKRRAKKREWRQRKRRGQRRGRGGPSALQLALCHLRRKLRRTRGRRGRRRRAALWRSRRDATQRAFHALLRQYEGALAQAPVVVYVGWQAVAACVSLTPPSASQPCGDGKGGFRAFVRAARPPGPRIARVAGGARRGPPRRPPAALPPPLSREAHICLLVAAAAAGGVLAPEQGRLVARILLRSHPLLPEGGDEGGEDVRSHPLLPEGGGEGGEDVRSHPLLPEGGEGLLLLDGIGSGEDSDDDVSAHGERARTIARRGGRALGTGARGESSRGRGRDRREAQQWRVVAEQELSARSLSEKMLGGGAPRSGLTVTSSRQC